MIERVVWISLVLIIFPLYYPLNRRRINSRIWKWQLEKHVPFIPSFVIPYAVLYPILLFGGMAVWAYRPIEQVREYAIATLITLVVAFLFFIFYPTRTEEYVVAREGFFENMIKFIYKNDKRLNAFPSLHVAMAIVSSYFMSLWFPQSAYIHYLLVPLIVFSTVAIRQHHMPDIVGGGLLSLISIVISRLVA